MKYKKDRVQVFNPKSKYWVKINTKRGSILGHKIFPWKNIKKIKQYTKNISMTYKLSNIPIEKTLKVFRNKKELKLRKDYVVDIKNRTITLLTD